MIPKGILKKPTEEFKEYDKKQQQIKKFFDQNLESKIKNSNQESIRLCDVLTSNFVGFYFDANWCTHSQGFLKKLKEVYTLSKQKKLNFEIVHISADYDKKICLENYEQNHPDWFLWPNEDEISQELINFLDVNYVPSLVVVSSSFKLITNMGRKEINEKGLEAVVNWNKSNIQSRRMKIIKF